MLQTYALSQICTLTTLLRMHFTHISRLSFYYNFICIYLIFFSLSFHLACMLNLLRLFITFSYLWNAMKRRSNGEERRNGKDEMKTKINDEETKGEDSNQTKFPIWFVLNVNEFSTCAMRFVQDTIRLFVYPLNAQYLWQFHRIENAFVLDLFCSTEWLLSFRLFRQRGKKKICTHRKPSRKQRERIFYSFPYFIVIIKQVLRSSLNF